MNPPASRFSPFAAFTFLFALSVSLPHIIQAIFPGGSVPGFTKSSIPPEEPAVITKGESPVYQKVQMQENLAWIQGQDNVQLLRPADFPPGEELEPGEEGFGAEERVSLDLSPSLILEYNRSWDSLGTKREREAAGAAVFLSTRTEFQALVHHLRFDDNVDEIQGNGGSLELSHRFDDWELTGGALVHSYNSLHTSVNAYMEAGKVVTSKMYVTVRAAWTDMWERLANIRDKLRLFDIASAVTYHFRQFWSLYVLGDYGWYSDNNDRMIGVAEVTRQLPLLRGLSLGLGAEATTFLRQRPTYWTPSYYHLIYARLRWTNRPLPWPFPFTGAEDTEAPTLTGLVEYIPGINNRGYFEQTATAGMRLRVTKRISLDGQFSYFDSDDRFDSHYDEKRVDGKVVIDLP